MNDQEEPRRPRLFTRRWALTTAALTASGAAIGAIAGRKTASPMPEPLPLAAAVEAPLFLTTPPPSDDVIDAILWKLHSDSSPRLMAIADPADRLAAIGRQTNVDLYDPRVLRAQLRAVRFDLMAVTKGKALVNAAAKRHFKFEFDFSDVDHLMWQHIEKCLTLIEAFSFYPKALFEIIEFETKHGQYPDRQQVFKFSKDIKKACGFKLAAGCELSNGPVQEEIDMDDGNLVTVAVHEWLGHRLMNSLNKSDHEWIAHFISPDVYLGDPRTEKYLHHRQTKYSANQYGLSNANENYATSLALDSSVESFADWDPKEFGFTTETSSPRVVLQAALLDLMANAVDKWQAQRHGKRSDANQFFVLRHLNLKPDMDGARAIEHRTMRYVKDLQVLVPLRTTNIYLKDIYVNVVASGTSWLDQNEKIQFIVQNKDRGRVQIEQLNEADPSKEAEAVPERSAVFGAVQFEADQKVASDIFRISDRLTSESKTIRVSCAKDVGIEEIGIGPLLNIGG